jgi:iron complex transport system permease protein
MLFFLTSLLIGPVSGFDREIILTIRLPRVILSSLVGLSLAITGLLTQTLFRNPIAEPYLLGISAGAALGAFTGRYFFNLFPFETQIFSFIFAQLTIILVVIISRSKGELPRETLLLSGIAISLLLSSILAFLIFISPSERMKIFYFLFGSFSFTTYNEVFIMLAALSIVIPFIITNLKKYDIMLLSEEEAHSLGIDMKRERTKLILKISFLASICVSVSGIIGFIGLIVPHISRKIAGTYSHKNIFPYLIFIGAIMLLLCDNLSRTVMKGAEIPVGVFTSILGVPFFLLILRKNI